MSETQARPRPHSGGQQPGQRRGRIGGWRALCLSLLLLYAGGFCAYLLVSLEMGKAEQLAPRPLGVVFTGAPGRLEFGADLLRKGQIERLFVSGVGRQTEQAELARSLGLPPPLADCCFALGYEATSTRGNFCEVQDLSATGWPRAADTPAYLVSSYYHLPRIALMRRRFWPGRDVQLIAASPPTWRKVPHLAALRTLAIEYNKLLITPLWLALGPRASCYLG